MQFIDEAQIVVRSGAGGNGSKSFRREKYIPRGGPDGGDGGKGGDVVVEVDGRSRSLLDFQFQKVYAAEDGANGSGARKTGRDGTDLRLLVPPGTQIWDTDSGQLLGDLTEEGDRTVILKGGNGGWGNVHFATATRQAPDRANPGQPSLQKTLRLELKLLADVALVGFPNAGKSSLIRAISASQARVADYPFTTLEPNLGVVRHAGRVFTVADIPGLIEGAADGAGLGHRFLKHIERCNLLVFLLSPVDALSPQDALLVLRAELAAYNPELLQRPQLLCLSKCDILGEEADGVAAHLAALIGEPVLPMSPVTGMGLPALLDRVASHFDPPRPQQVAEWSPATT
jgi:GTP-binding protein